MLNKNSKCFFLSLILGFLISYYFPRSSDKEIISHCPEAQKLKLVHEYENDIDFEPKLNLDAKPLIAKKQVKNIVRPRYFSTELGIREKLFIGVLTMQNNIESLATAFNKTAAHHTNRIKFFIHAENVKTNFKLKNIVGFTDTRENYRTFHVLKYIADNYIEDFDFFYLIDDSAYLNAKRLKTLLEHISISFDLYMGSKASPDDKHCELSGGIIFSNSVIRKIKSNVDACVKNAIGNRHSETIFNCVKLSTDIQECQTSWQGININSFKLNSYKVYRDLYFLKEDEKFNQAVSVYPVHTPDDLYMLHAYFSRLHLEDIQKRMKSLEQESQNISNGTISNNILEVRWPLGVPNSGKPQSRHDILVWTHLNLTHSYMSDPETNVKPLTKIEQEDIQKILNRILTDAAKKHPNLKFDKLRSAYKKFDAVRGMDYRMQLAFRDPENIEVLKSYEVVKPISLIEIVPSPYVTESTRITIVLPTFEHNIENSMDFVNRYQQTCMESQDNTFLMLVLLYRVDSSNKGDADVFLRLKTLALSLSEKYKGDNSRVAWVSIRLPEEFSDDYNENDLMINSVYGMNEVLSLAVTDLALRKIGLESLVMLISNTVSFKSDFLNRVRMNTIQGFQIFSPVGFMMYPCKYTHLCKECETCDVAQSTGYFDRHNYDVVSFYSRDYVEGE